MPYLAAAAVLSLLPAACGGSPATPSTTPPGRATAALAFSRCMRAHGVARFPDPDSQGNFPSLDQQALGVSKQTTLVARQACKKLLPDGGGPATPQQRAQKLEFALKVARCLRSHGYPDFPDPSTSGQRLPPGVDTGSPQFQAAESACERQARKALGLP